MPSPLPPSDATPMLPLDEVVKQLTSPGLGFERVHTIVGSTYEDNSTVIVVPLRDRRVHWRVAWSWLNLIHPMNQPMTIFPVVSDEVGVAYTKAIQMILDHPTFSKFRYVMTMESDNIQPPDAHVRLLESIRLGFDAVSGIYFTKGDVGMPMAYGDPDSYLRTGEIDFRPRNMVAALKHGHVVPVNGIAMGCSLYRMGLFREIESPWFVTVSDHVPGKGAIGMTQDLFFCRRAVAAGKKFAVDARVRVGHIDVKTDIVY